MPHLLKELPRNITTFGDFEFQIILLATFFIFDLDPLWKHLLLGLLLTYSTSSIYRLIFFKERPEKIAYRNIPEKIFASSFPSVHSVNSTYLATILINYFSNVYFSGLVILLAGSVCISRIHLKKHFKKDVIAGIIWGIVEAVIVINLILV